MKILLDTSLLLPTLRIEVKRADEIIDCLLYSTALHSNMKFASLDNELRNSNMCFLSGVKK